MSCDCCFCLPKDSEEKSDISLSSEESQGAAEVVGEEEESSNENLRLYVAKYNYNSRSDDDISFLAGDYLYVIDKTEGDWWFARHKISAKEGYIPSNYMAEYKTLDAEEWYMGRMKRSEAEKTLTTEINAIAGRFLIRESETTPGEHSLSIRDAEQVRHYRIRKLDNGNYFISRRADFKSIQDLVAYYQRQADGLCVRLHSAADIICKPDTVGLSKAMNEDWEIDRSKVRFVKLLGAGQFGEVWEAKLNESVSVAVKTLKEGAMSKSEFLQEASLMKKLRHPNLIQLYAVCTTDGPIFIITELMANGSLLTFLRKQGRSLRHSELIDMAAQVAAGMAYLESQNYIHRDLAARNILVGENHLCKVADFGLARVLYEDFYEAQTNTKVPVKWTAPEAALYNRFSIKSDVWSFGITLYEIITYGRSPYPGMSNAEVLDRIQQGYRMPSPSTCPEPYYLIMLECWRTNPEIRPTFESLQWRLEDFSVATERIYRDPEYFFY